MEGGLALVARGAGTAVVGGQTRDARVRDSRIDGGARRDGSHGRREVWNPGASLDLLFRGAQREPSGMFDALAMEMPLVELRPGEFYPTRDRIVEGSAQPDVKVFLGQFGVVEIPYVVRRINGEWRVEPQPYYAWFNR